MFGYTTDLRSATQGRATSSMEFAYYQPLAEALAKEIIEEATRIIQGYGDRGQGTDLCHLRT